MFFGIEGCRPCVQYFTTSTHLMAVGSSLRVFFRAAQEFFIISRSLLIGQADNYLRWPRRDVIYARGFLQTFVGGNLEIVLSVFCWL